MSSQDEMMSTDALEQVENEVIEEYVKVYPYPSFTKMMNNIKEHIELWAEYGKFNHICCKLIYENPTDKEMIIKMGTKIYERGGMQALSCNHAVIKYFSPYWESNNPIVKSHGAIIEDYFQEITPEWKA